MTRENLSKCYALLKLMPAGLPWCDEQCDLFNLILGNLDDEIGIAAVKRAVIECEWRPAPAILLRLAAEAASPTPTSQDAYAEIMDMAMTRGQYARRVEGRNAYVLGDPEWSHPIITNIVRSCGGYRMICTGEAQMQGGLKRQVEDAHETATAQWAREVRAQLVLPANERDRRYFPAYTRPAIAPPVEETHRQLPPMVERGEPTPMPESLRRMIRSIKSMPEATV